MNSAKLEGASDPVRRSRVANKRGRAYTGAIHCATSMLNEEGYAAFYKGFFATLARQVGPVRVHMCSRLIEYDFSPTFVSAPRSCHLNLLKSL